MNEEKLDKVKLDTIELINSLLSNSKNKAGLITFETNSQIISNFTNNKDDLIGKVNRLSTTGCTNYYQALINVDSILKEYVKEKDRECIVLFLTDGYPNEDIPNEVAQYEYLKSQYPFITINGIQYEMGKTILEPIKKVSDYQFIADMQNLNNVLFEASITSTTYENFEITDYIDTDYFYIEDESNIKTNRGKATLDKESQKITWIIDELNSGRKAKMTIKVKLKEEFVNQGGIFPTNKKEEIKSKLDENEEKVTSESTPILADNYKVVYDDNAPFGCKVEGDIPNERYYSVFDSVEISEQKLRCSGYKFKGWEIVTENVSKLNMDYFVMPEKDVVIRAVWGRTSVEKKLEGTVSKNSPNFLERVIYNEETDEMEAGLHKYADSLVEIVFQDSIKQIPEAIDVLDLSENKDKRIMGYIVPREDDNTKYTAYIQSDETILANPDSSYLFYEFTNLKSIININLLDTSNVENMTLMFYNCGLENLDFSNFNTSKVTNMYGMFYWNEDLAELDLSNFDTSKVTKMSYMFAGSSKLLTLNISNFDFSNVEDVSYMFWWCTGLNNLIVTNMNLYNVVNMDTMFAYVGNINISLTLGNKISSYSNAFGYISTSGDGKIIVNYLEGSEELADKIIATRQERKNVVKGQAVSLTS
ncbi:MAG: BspA family leucine-rich repeat surface protein [Bacilli bacterium]|nr:BspA family leucine-rich repeat surface protein [Bacilli bacterium]